MNIRYPNIIHNANVDKVMRYKPKREYEFGQYNRKIKQNKEVSDVDIDVEMDEEPYTPPEQLEEEFKNDVQPANQSLNTIKMDDISLSLIHISEPTRQP